MISLIHFASEAPVFTLSSALPLYRALPCSLPGNFNRLCFMELKCRDPCCRVLYWLKNNDFLLLLCTTTHFSISATQPLLHKYA